MESLDDVAGVLDSLTAGTVTFFAPVSDQAAADLEVANLRARVQGPAGLDAFFSGVIAIEHLRDALALRPRLKAGQSVITRDGVWIGPDWLRVSRDRDAHEGVLEREQELRRQRRAVEEQTRQHQSVEADLEGARSLMRDLEDRLSQAQQQVADRGAEHLKLRAELDGLLAHAERRAERLQQVAQQLASLDAEIESAAAAHRSAAERLETAADAAAELEQLARRAR